MKLEMQDLLARLATGDFGALDAVEERFGVSPEARKRRELAAAEVDELARAAARIDDRFLQWLVDQTWGRLTYDVMSHPDPQVAHQYGVFREGQNALASTILAMVAKGRNVGEVQLATKGNTDAAARSGTAGSAGKPAGTAGSAGPAGPAGPAGRRVQAAGDARPPRRRK